ncbi:hypothetical protein TIFTF001_026716 [Ficus carica]|uniref:Ribosomal RNA-processing protein 7 C-terminal domain-containing protein n=1 Tax=Ficus carica TaxID=3494 RepID=A0AA88ITX8_FICCA|nr:hypothetical protein TIFTF001_026716 [Ficus carica]
MGTKDLLNKKRRNKEVPIKTEDRKIVKTEVETKKDQLIEKKSKRKKEQNVGIVQDVQIPAQDSFLASADNAIRAGTKKRGEKSPRNKRVKNVENSNALVTKSDQADNETDGGFNEEKGRSKKARKKEKEQNSLKELEKLPDKEDAYQNEVFNVPAAHEDRLKRKKGKSKEVKKKKKKDYGSSKEVKSQEKEGGADEDNVYIISSVDEDSSKGMKKWITEYHQSRPGLTILQQRIDEFITANEEKLEQERKEREARAAEGGWTVVTHHKGRKKTTDAESGVTVGSVAQAVVEGNLAKKKSKEVGLDFYRFQRKEAQRNEIMMLQSKFEQDKKRIQQFRAARKFRPY